MMSLPFVDNITSPESTHPCITPLPCTAPSHPPSPGQHPPPDTPTHQTAILPVNEPLLHILLECFLVVTTRKHAVGCVPTTAEASTPGGMDWRYGLPDTPPHSVGSATVIDDKELSTDYIFPSLSNNIVEYIVTTKLCFESRIRHIRWMVVILPGKTQ